MKKQGVLRVLAPALALGMLLSVCAPSALAAKTGVEVSSGKSGTELTQGEDADAHTPFPYGQRVKVNDLIYYLTTDFVEAKEKKVFRYTYMDPKANAELTMLEGSNWYSTESLTHLLERFLTSTYPRVEVATAPVSDDYAEAKAENPDDYSTSKKTGETVEEATEAEEIVDSDYYEEEYVDDEPFDDEPVASVAGSGAAVRYSTTNVQVTGVDEADIVKTDGKYIYYLSTSGIAIMEANNGYPRQVAKLKPNAQVGQSLPSYEDLYISGNTLIILASKSNVNIFDGIDTEQGSLPNNLYRQNSNTFASIDFYDISNAANPRLVRQINIEGSFNSTRLYNHSLYYVINTPIGRGDGTLVSVLPKYQDSLLGKEYYVIQPKDLYMDVYGYSTMSTQIIGAISLTDEQAIQPKAYEIDYGADVYMSQDSLYLADRRSVYPKDSKNVPSVVDKSLKATLPYMTDSNLKSERDETLLRRFSLGKNTVKFTNMGRIWGSLSNERYMNVNNGNLRVVTTGNPHGNYIRQSLVSVLDAKTLGLKGKSAYFAQNDSISSVRYMGNYAYLSDSSNMRVFDLSNFGKPVEVGVIDTFSGAGYLHSVGDGRLLGIGTDIEATYVKTPDTKREKQIGYRNGGVKFTLFDVSDPKKPAVLDTMVVGSNGSSTLSTSDPKSLMYDSVKGVMTMPFSYEDYEIIDDYGMNDTWKGGLAIEVKNKEIKLGATFSLGSYYTSSDSRFVFIDNVLYYVSAPYLVALNYDTYKIMSSLALEY